MDDWEQALFWVKKLLPPSSFIKSKDVGYTVLKPLDKSTSENRLYPHHIQINITSCLLILWFRSPLIIRYHLILDWIILDHHFLIAFHMKFSNSWLSTLRHPSVSPGGDLPSAWPRFIPRSSTKARFVEVFSVCLAGICRKKWRTLMFEVPCVKMFMCLFFHLEVPCGAGSAIWITWWTQCHTNTPSQEYRHWVSKYNISPLANGGYSIPVNTWIWLIYMVNIWLIYG